MQLPWRRSFEEQIAAGVEREFERYRQRCLKLHENFHLRMRLRDEARKELEAVEAELRDLQGTGVSLLGEMNAAMLDEDERTLKQVKSRQDAHSRKLGNAQSRRDRVTKRLAELEFDEGEAAGELVRAGREQATEAESRAEELKAFLNKLLDAQQREISEAAGLPLGEQEDRRSS